MRIRKFVLCVILAFIMLNDKECVLGSENVKLPVNFNSEQQENEWLNQYSEEEQEMLQKIAIAEAKGEGVLGMSYVIKVVLNRVESDQFPNTIEEVIFQKTQFTTVKNGSYSEAKPDEESYEALLSCNKLNDEMLYFENDHGNKDTWHRRNLAYVCEYKNHTFYK